MARPGWRTCSSTWCSRAPPTRGNLMTALAQRGMAFNGSTWYDRTNYFETFPATDANLDWALGMEADRMVNSTVLRRRTWTAR